MSSPTPRPVPADDSIRLQVLDTSKSWILQAPAGSGKTELLMQRYLACLATVEQPESVLAITFTRKAAAEMRGRILASLQKAGRMSVAEISACPEYEQKSLQLARAVLENSAALGWKILEHPSRLQVRTLDSFCEAVAQRAPFKGLLGGVAQVTEDAGPLYEMAAQRVIDQLAQPGSLGNAVASLLIHVDNNVRGIRSLLAAMLQRRDQWLHFLGRSDAFDAAQQELLRTRLEAALVLSVEEDMERSRAHAARVLGGLTAELLELMRYAASQLDSGVAVIESIAASAEPFPSRPGANAGSAAALPAARAASLPAWRALSDFLLTSERSRPAFRKLVNKKHGFPAGTRQKSQCVDLLSRIARLPGAEELCEFLNRIRRLPDPHYTDPQWNFIRAVLEVLPLAAANLKVIFSEQGTVDFAEYAQRALDAIGQEGDPTELGLQLGYRIRHILVDEFQDTNRVQVELLERLLATWEADEQCSTFCVGDPMQSIYAFRQADVAIYQNVRAAGIGGHRLKPGELSRNFRSQQKLVEWFNEVFSLVLSEDSALTNAVKYVLAEPTRPALGGPAVCIRGFAKDQPLAEAKHLAECIKRELAAPTPEGSKPLTIAVLVRSRAHLPELVEAMRNAGVDYRAVKTDRLTDRPPVHDLEALRAALTDLADRTAWLSILRAPWCGLDLADLLELCRDDRESTVCQLLRLHAGRLSQRGQAALARCLPILEDAIATRGRSPLRLLVESTWLRLGGPSCLGKDREQGIRDASAYFALLDAQSSAGMLRDPDLFATKLHDLFAPADTRSGIRVEIMPIHQAKGLEWDVVFLPALERHARQDNKSLLYWRRRTREKEEFLLLGPMEASGKKDAKAATIESYLRGISSECSREELKRLFYVAATRAKRRLYLSAAVSEHNPNANSMLRLLWDLPGMQHAFAPPESSQEAQPQPPPVLPRPGLRRLPETFTLPALAEPLQWSAEQHELAEEKHRFEWVGDLLPRIGIVAHRFLQRIAQQGPASWDSAALFAARPVISAALLREGVTRGDLELGITRVTEALSKTLVDERGRWLLSPHPEHRSEFAVSAFIEGRVQHVRVDRTFIVDGVRWLIDYKITEQLGGDTQRYLQMQVEKYRPDMERYVRVMRIFDPRPVRCALYLPLLGAFCPVEIGPSPQGDQP